VQSIPTSWQKEFFELPPDGACEKQRFSIGRKSYVERQKEQDARRAKSQRGVNTEEALWKLNDQGGARDGVTFIHQDVGAAMPDGPFDIICSRYAVCLYLEQEKKAEVLTEMVRRLRPGGYLVIGRKDRLPEGFCASEGLTQVHYRGEDEFCPYCTDQLLQDIFIKDGRPALPAATDDQRYKASTYAAYLKSIGQVPDWIAERERLWAELRCQRMTDKSKRILEKASLEGRRTDMDGSLLNRMARDAEDRQERHRAREAQKASEVEAALSTTGQSLTQEEASTKVQSFFARLQQDAAQREAAQIEAQKQQRKLEKKQSRRNRSLNRSSSAANGGKSRRSNSKGLATEERKSNKSSDRQSRTL